MILRSVARPTGAVVLLPAIDSGLFDWGSSARSIALLVGLASIAIIALLVAAAAHRSSRGGRTRSSVDDEQLFTTTPLPMPKEELERLMKNPPHQAYRSLKLPRWVQLGSLVIALGFTYAVAQRMRPNNSASSTLDDGRASARTADRAGDDTSDSPEDLDLSPDSAPPFSFRARDWVKSGAGCEGRLEVTDGEPSAWSLVARVHDGQGQLLDSARTRVASLRPGDVVEFTFARAACDRIGAWDVRGDRRD